MKRLAVVDRPETKDDLVEWLAENTDAAMIMHEEGTFSDEELADMDLGPHNYWTYEDIAGWRIRIYHVDWLPET